jgi:hypothetical protein
MDNGESASSVSGYTTAAAAAGALLDDGHPGSP